VVISWHVGVIVDGNRCWVKNVGLVCKMGSVGVDWCINMVSISQMVVMFEVLG